VIALLKAVASYFPVAMDGQRRLGGNSSPDPVFESRTISYRIKGVGGLQSALLRSKLNQQRTQKMIGRTITKWISEFFSNLEWLVTHMDMTQWGIVSVIFVVVGFMALRTRL
jgi:hypothetical protein